MHSLFRDGQVAQLVEHATENRGVDGSIPPLATLEPVTFHTLGTLRFIATMAATCRMSIKCP